MTIDFEELYLQSEQAIKEGDLIRARQLIEQMLSEEPNSAIAHNSMGWFYRVQFEAYEKAEMHFKAAIRFNPEYPHAYWNYVSMLLDLERFKDLEKLLSACLKKRSLSKALIYSYFGEMHELTGDFPQAIKYYRQAIRKSVKNDHIETYWESIKRCEDKIALDKGEDPGGIKKRFSSESPDVFEGQGLPDELDLEDEQDSPTRN